MKRLLLFFPIVILALIGCQNQHAKDKQAALQRWSQARVQLTTNMAQQQFQSGQLAKAAKTAENAVEIDSRYIPAHSLLGRIYIEQNKLVEARKCFETCLKIDPSDAQANYNLGIIHEKRGSVDKAESYYREAWEKQPWHEPYLLALTETLVDQGRHQEGLDLLMRFIESGNNQDDGDASVYVAAGNILLTLKRPAEAAGMFRDAVNLAPENQNIIESLAYTLVEADQPQEALNLFSMLKEQAEKEGQSLNWSYYLAMGDCYMKLSSFYQAQRCFEYVSEHDTSNPAVWTRLAQTALARNDFERANIWALKSLALQSQYSEALKVLGYIAFKQGQYQKAEDFLRQAVKADGGDGLAYCLLGQTLQAQGLNQQAMKCYGQALNIDPEDRLAKKLMVSVENIRVSEGKNLNKF